MSKNLVIVESPAKAKTIEKFLGADYHVLSSQGHIRDIEGQGKNSLGIDFNNGYEPNYVIDASKERLIQTLRTEAKKADMVWLASDEDREGEAIAWHLKEVLELKPERTKRIVFHEITKTAIQEAILSPRDIDYNLVSAQQARRVMDRIVGFELSPVLWRKISTGLSAGRVQSVAVRLVVEREEEIESFKPTAQYRVTADFIGKDAQGKEVLLKTELNHRFQTKEDARAFLDQLKSAEFALQSIQKKPSHRSPAPPFTTSDLQQEAAKKLRFPVAKTMRIAQALYESGKITYMRTDSVNLSNLALGTSRQEVLKEYGEEYYKMRQYRTASKGAQEAHEAIRPTYMENRQISGTADEKNLYSLIWKRTLASQMADAQLETTRMEISVSGSPYLFVASGEVVLFDGFMRVYVQTSDDDQEGESNLLPMMAEGEKLQQKTATAQQTYTKSPQRYNEATLVKKMEELGIGRPSTYATIIETIQQRHYVENGNVAGKKRTNEVLTLRSGKITEKLTQETV
ncbi:MAG: type I DNA topoisomerase, partial [Bacteroidales bacterium]|nr:type I DNA topoisomerase [Candidatus Colicola faecequi]